MYAFINGYSGQAIYDDYYIACYNLIFTALPLLIKAVFEQDINYDTDGIEFKKYLTKLYYVGQKSMIFNWKNFSIWYITGLIHSVIIFVVPFFVFETAILLKSG